MKLLKLFCPVILLLLQACSSESPTEPNGENPPPPEQEVTIGVEKAFPNLSFNFPLDLQSPADGSNRIFVVEREGRIHVFDNNSQVEQAAVFLDISDKTDTSSGEMGLLGLAFHPNYANNGQFFIYYTPGPGESVLSRFTVSGTDANLADPGSETEMLSIAQPFMNHNGGQLAFGPDGYLYVALGDGGSGGDPQGNGQNLNTLLGKILRLDIDRSGEGTEYGIPADNPFVGEAGARPEIFAYGLRNPWRMSFDTATGQLWAGDVGQAAMEEIDVIVAGGNYGWNYFEGSLCFTEGNCTEEGLIFPVVEYNHDQGDRSVTGGFVYRGEGVEALVGDYIFADFSSGRIWTIPSDSENPDSELLLDTDLNISSFGTDQQEELYICSFDGFIYRFVAE